MQRQRNRSKHALVNSTQETKEGEETCSLSLSRAVANKPKSSNLLEAADTRVAFLFVSETQAITPSDLFVPVF
jgi:hypothetical protein